MIWAGYIIGWTSSHFRRFGAVQVHHLRYPQGELPGSDAWIRLEKLFDLVGPCEGFLGLTWQQVPNRPAGK
jgi:hypothetical protein